MQLVPVHGSGFEFEFEFELELELELGSRSGRPFGEPARVRMSPFWLANWRPTGAREVQTGAAASGG